MKFGVTGDPNDPPSITGYGSTRDRVDPPVIVIKSGDTVNYVNSGFPHQVAVYGKGLTKNGSLAPTTFADINVAAGTGAFIDDPVGRLTQGEVGANVSWTFTNTTGAVEQYVVICTFRPHFVDYAMAQIVLVTPGS